ncbi:MAG: thioredoxin family protein, partial [Victivallaceae bacterium]
RKVGIMIYFSGTDWCPACKIFEKHVLSKPEFINYANKNLVLVNIDFPRDSSKVSQETKDYNDKLVKSFGVVGFPSIFLLRSNGTLATSEVGYRGESASRYVAKIKAILTKAEQTVKSGDVK